MCHKFGGSGHFLVEVNGWYFWKLDPLGIVKSDVGKFLDTGIIIIMMRETATRVKTQKIIKEKRYHIYVKTKLNSEF